MSLPTQPLGSQLAALALAALLTTPTFGQSADALIVLTTIGYLTGAADACKVAPAESNALSSGIALAIGGGKYGDQAQAHVLLKNASQEGVSAATSGKVNCAKVGELVREQARSAMAKRP